MSVFIPPIHPAAMPALRAWQALRRQCSEETLPEPLARMLVETTPVPVVPGDDRGFLAVGGFDILDLARSIGAAPRVQVLDPEKEDLDHIAWATVLRVLIMTLERDVGLAVMVEAVNNNMPPDLVRRLFGRKRLSAPILARICRVSARTIKSQQEAMRKRDPKKAESILTLLRKARS